MKIKPVATDWDHRIIDGTSVALKGEIGMADDVMRLKKLVESGPAKDKLETACEIAVSFIRWAQDLKRQNADDSTRRKLEALDYSMNGNRQLAFDREHLGQMVREVWIRWAKEQPNPKPHWLTPWEQLAEPDREVDRMIGDEIARWAIIGDSAMRSQMLDPSADETE